MGRESFVFSSDTMEILFPMFVSIGADGRIENRGPTLGCIFADDILGKAFFDTFQVEKPRGIKTLEALRKKIGVKLVLTSQPDAGDPIQFRGVITPLNDTTETLFLDLSIGVSLADAIKRFDLTGVHFRPNDFSIDLFYTLETQRTLLDDSNKMAMALTTAKEDAERKAYIDTVTGIANRRALNHYLEHALNGPKNGTEFALLHLDLDKFKLLNDTFGHAAGDEILKHTAKVIQTRINAGDIAARIGGDEFAMVLRNADDEEALVRMAYSLINEISLPVRIDGDSCNVGASIGIVRFRAETAPEASRLLMNSDIALYEAKGVSDPVKMLTPEMIRTHTDRVTLIAKIEEGLGKQQFAPYFQPQIDTRNRYDLRA